MYTSTKIDTENAKTIRSPFDVEMWVADDYYNITTPATLIRLRLQYNALSGIPNTEIPGGDYRLQLLTQGASNYTKFINLTDLCKIAQRRGYPMTYGYDPSTYYPNGPLNTFLAEFIQWQNWAIDPTQTAAATVPIEAVTSASQRKRMLVLVLREWTDDTEFTISLGSGWSKTYSGADIENNNIIVDLVGKATTDTTATLTWINRGGALVGCFSQSYTYYVNKKNLIRADVALRSDLQVNASTIPTSQINVTALADKEIYDLYNVTYLMENNLYYICGYNSDMPTAQASIAVNPNLPVIARRFCINTPLSFDKYTISIEAEDFISELYNTSTEGVLYHNGFISLFGDHIDEVYEEGLDTYYYYQLSKITNELLGLNQETDFRVPDVSEWDDPYEYQRTGRYQFICWLLFYAYFSSMWSRNKRMACAIARDFRAEYAYDKDRDAMSSSSRFFAPNNPTYQEDLTLDTYNAPNRNNESHTAREMLGAIDDVAPLPLMAWIMDAWHGSTTIQNINGATRNIFLRPQFVDAGRPKFSLTDQSPVLTIHESDCTNISDVIEIPKKVLQFPRRHLVEQFDAYQLKGLATYTGDDGREDLINWSKARHTVNNQLEYYDVYYYSGGFHYYVQSDFAFQIPLGSGHTEDTFISIDDYYSTESDLVYPGMRWKDLLFGYKYPHNFTYSIVVSGTTQYLTAAAPDPDPTQWTARGYVPYIAQTSSTLSESSVEDGDTINVSYENYMGKIIDNTLIKNSMLKRNNRTGSFTWRGDPRLQPRDIFTFVRLDGTTINCTIETIETKHEGGGTMQTITYREGII